MKLTNITRYCGFITVLVEWLGFGLCVLVQRPNLAEPGSQYGYYPSTRLIFALTFTLAAVSCYLFARHLNEYWRPTSLMIFLAGVSFAIIGWVPYEPYVRSFVLDIHNIAVVLSVTLYSLPMLMIGYSKAHAGIAKVSAILYILTALLAGWSLIARVNDVGIIYAQVAAFLPMQAWYIIVNILLLQHHRKLAINLPVQL